MFGQEEIKFLDYLVSGEEIRLPDHVKAILKYQKPQTVKDLRT